MAAIHVLKPQIANQIAAGEVVERPASVVKELVENAIDAGATAITVQIENGGMRTIVVSDNGCGIAKDDCRKAFLRHATSKITTADDLSRVMTLGFRGEALASIASVSRVTMVTRPKEAETGTRIVIDNGIVKSEEDVSCVFGTVFSVEGLFASVPARLKFLKSARTEAGYIGDYVGKMILARPEISFKYVNDGKTVYETFGDGDLYNAIFSVYGSAIAEKIVPVSYDNGYLKITGYLGLPEISRNNRMHQTVFINGRSIRSATVSAAVAQAYDTRLMIGRFPLFVLNLSISPQEVDVNVHPTKAEVRFADENKVFLAVSAASKLALSASDRHVESALDTVQPKQPSVPNYEWKESPAPRVDFHSYAAAAGQHSYREGNYSTFIGSGSHGGVPTYQIRIEEKTAPKTAEPGSPLFEHDPIRIIGCVFQTYWLVEKGENLYLVDQHAAHERKLYDALASNEISVSAQQLLVSKEITLTPSEMELYTSNQKMFLDLGFGLIQSGPRTITMSEAPVLNGRTLDEGYLHAALGLLAEQKENVRESLLKERLMQTACKHAVKGGEPVEETEIRSLLETFLSGEVPLTCPHGRPVVVRISKTELEKMFRRIV